jgi:hypothetical protein
MYRNIDLNGVSHSANLGVLLDHRIAIKDGEIEVSADLDGRTPGADFEATFTGRGDTLVLIAPEDYAIGSVVMEPGDDLKLAQDAKLSEIAATRYEVEIGGITINDMKIATDRESRSLLTGAMLTATLDVDYTCQWKTAGGFVTLDAATILAVAQAVRAHVQACFDKEAELTAMIEAATTIAEVDAVSWETQS